MSKNMHYNNGLTLGQIVNELRKLNPEAYIQFDFGSANITTLDSYRGFYDQLALGYDGAYASELNTVGAVLKECENAIGKTFSGWKGGDYTMHEDTNIFVANPGCTSHTSIKQIEKLYDDWYVVRTKYEANA